MLDGPRDGINAQVHRLFQFGVVGTLSDSQLLDRFVSHRDEGAEVAFEELVIRHAPMVLRVCQSVLRDPHDAEDAFQAVFLVLASRAGTIRARGSIASWLFGVARRVATRARRTAARRRTLERRVAERSGEYDLPGADHSDCEALHEEIDRLPERLRAPVVLCYLEGLTHGAAARQLGLSPAAVRGRLARARTELRRRLVRIGISRPDGLIVVGLAGRARLEVPSTLIHSTVKFALGLLAGDSAHVLARGVLNSMLLKYLRVAAAILSLCVGTGYGTWRLFAAVTNQDAPAPPRPGAQGTRNAQPPGAQPGRSLRVASFVEAYTRTPIYLRHTARIGDYRANLGQYVKKGDVLATLLVPELVLEDHAAKKAAVEVAARRAELARKTANLPQAEVKAATATLAAAQRELSQLEAMVGPLPLLSPSDGVIVARNAKPVEPGPRERNNVPIYVVDDIDTVRVFADIPEQNTAEVHAGAKASVLVKSIDDKPIPVTITHAARAINSKSRQLRAEIDLPNGDHRLKPGMFALVEITLPDAP